MIKNIKCFSTLLASFLLLTDELMLLILEGASMIVPMTIIISNISTIFAAIITKIRFSFSPIIITIFYEFGSINPGETRLGILNKIISLHWYSKQIKYWLLWKIFILLFNGIYEMSIPFALRPIHGLNPSSSTFSWIASCSSWLTILGKFPPKLEQ